MSKLYINTKFGTFLNDMYDFCFEVLCSKLDSQFLAPSRLSSDRQLRLAGVYVSDRGPVGKDAMCSGALTYWI